MLAKDLIKELERLIAEHEPVRDMFGELDIQIDVWKQIPESKTLRRYAGFSPNVSLDVSDCGVYYILAAKETWHST